MNNAEAIHNRTILKKLFKAFIDNPSKATVRDILGKAPMSYCWLQATRIIPYGVSCPSLCPGLIKKNGTPTFLCSSFSFYDTWQTKPEKALLFAIQFLAFLESHGDSDEQSKGNT